MPTKTCRARGKVQSQVPTKKPRRIRGEVQNQVPTKKTHRARGAGTCVVGRPGWIPPGEEILPKRPDTTGPQGFRSGFKQKKQQQLRKQLGGGNGGARRDEDREERTALSFPLSWPHHTVCRILAPCSGTEPVRRSGVWRPNHWTVRELPRSLLQIHQGKGT